jgi:hypothetical protein
MMGIQRMSMIVGGIMSPARQEIDIKANPRYFANTNGK